MQVNKGSCRLSKSVGIRDHGSDGQGDTGVVGVCSGIGATCARVRGRTESERHGIGAYMGLEHTWDRKFVLFVLVTINLDGDRKGSGRVSYDVDWEVPASW